MHAIVLSDPLVYPLGIISKYCTSKWKFLE